MRYKIFLQSLCGVALCFSTAFAATNVELHHPVVYVADGKNVGVFDLGKRSLIDYLKPTLTSQWSPKSITLSPDNKFVYVLNYQPAALSIFDAKSRTEVKSIGDFSSNTTLDTMSIAPNHEYAYVGVSSTVQNDSECHPPNMDSCSAIFRFDLKANKIAGYIDMNGIDQKHGAFSFNGEITHIVFSHDGKKALIFSSLDMPYSFSGYIVDTATQKVVARAPVSDLMAPANAVFSLDDKTAYVLGEAPWSSPMRSRVEIASLDMQAYTYSHVVKLSDQFIGYHPMIQLAADGKRVYLWHTLGNGGFNVFNIRSEVLKRIANPPPDDPPNLLMDVVIDESSQVLYYTRGNENTNTSDTVTVELKTGAESNRFQNTGLGWNVHMAFSPK